MKPYKRTIPIYEGKLIVILSNDFGVSLSELGEQFENANEYGGFCFRGKGFREYVIILPPDAEPCIIAHECLHATNYCLSDSGVGVTLENDEAQAHLLGWFVGEVYEAIKKIHKTLDR